MDENRDTVGTVQTPATSPRQQRHEASPMPPGQTRAPAPEAVDESRDTRGQSYTTRLEQRGGARWKQILDVQAPYRWNIRRLNLGRTLDVGCGIGRNLGHLDGNGVGVDHNPTSVAAARERGLIAYTPEEFAGSGHARPGAFDSMLVAHVMEHLPEAAGRDLVRSYLPYVRPGGRVVFITPQQRGYRSDPTHVRFVGFDELAQLVAELGLELDRRYSFPLPTSAGPVFTYNEFVAIGRLPR